MSTSSKKKFESTDIYKIWRHEGGRKAIQALGDPIHMYTARLGVKPYADLAEGILHVHAKGRWDWTDNHGNTEERGSFLGASYRFARDMTLSPFIANKHAKVAVQYLNLPKATQHGPAEACPLYMRMDHLFDLKAGGSVAHTSGVLNSLRALCGVIDVVSTDKLTSVDVDAAFHEVTPKYNLGRNMPNIPLLTYNSQVISYVKKNFETARFIYCRYALGNYAALAIARHMKVPYICEYNGSFLWMNKHWDTQKMKFFDQMLMIEDANLKGADLIVVVSQPSKVELVERGIPENRILVNPNGVDIERFTDLDDSAASLRRELGFEEDDIVFGFVGTFGQWHGTEVLSNAFAKLARSDHPQAKKIRLLMIGDGNFCRDCKDIIKSANISDQAIFTGTVPQENAPTYLNASDVLVSPHVPNPDGSAFFGSPTKLFEYMATGKPIIASALDQIGELLDHEQTAFLVEPGNIDELVNAMIKMIAKPEFRLKLGQEAFKICKTKHTWKQHTENILVALDRLV
ncbi:glycosyltransferase family 4 protein [Terasakiella pusilla]|uniref:glycosyltransferase family 4 protein n=1 Tax=Terasakiella pusilla TaxID=64973 RepID=UPI0006922300|nr:glycosyltransferase family 4 protein [Terasakiella pusilla]